MFTGWRRLGSSSVVATVVIAMVVSFLVVLSWNHQGYPAASVELNDDGVWVTNPGRQLIGHVNHTIDELDGAVYTEAAKFDVLQDGGLVLLHAESESGLYPVDPANQELGEKVALPPGSSLAVGGGRIASIESDSGKVRVGLTPMELSDGTEPVLEVGAGGRVVVGTDGDVHALSAATHKVETLTASGERRSVELSGGGAAESMSMTAVGGQPVVLDRAARTLVGDGWTANVGGSGDVVLQQRGPGGDAVVYATETELVSQPLGGGAPKVLASAQEKGKPAAPAVVAGCAHGAWASGIPTYVRVCGDDVEDMSEQLGTVGTDSLVFRTNRNAVVLNDAQSGDVYVATKNVRLVDNWEDVIPPDADTDEQDLNSQRNQEQAEQEREAGNRPPIAEDDEFGVRPGRTTTLPVLQNDSDPDGDLLTARLVGDSPPGASVTRADGGLALQIAVPDNASGDFPFRYQVSDGRGGTAEASVRVSVRPLSENEPPIARGVSEVVVAEGKSIDYNALANWTDPDGDTLYAKNATTGGAGDEARLLPNGRLTFIDGGQSTGEKIVTVTVSDGQAESSTDVKVQVTPLGEALPIANPDHAMVTVGRTATVRPLLNDLDPTGDQLRLVKFAETSKLTVNPDFTQGTVEVTAGEAGTHYLDYMVANGPGGSATGTIRIDAEDAGGADEPPTAADDVALLPVGGEVLSDVVENDYDPAGGVLVVTSVTSSAGSGLAVGVVNNQVLRIADASGLEAPTTIKYEISNGVRSAEGSVNVVPVAAADKLRPPAAEADEAIVRVDDIVTIPVLRNDTHPDGDTLALDSKLVQGVDPADGNLFVAGNTLRFRAGPKAKTVHAIYNVTDSQSQTDSAQVTIHILARDDEQNSAPKPPSVEARAIAGATTRIVIPTDAIDPDGDSATLDGIEEAPQQGRIGKVSGNVVEYTALADAAGVDTFTYKVRDRVGMAAVGQVTVGIAPANQENQAPAAIGDSVWVRPDRNLSVPVLLNDSDPDGDAIRLDPDSVGGGGPLKAEAKGDRVNMVSAHEPGVYSVNYTVVDAKGAKATAPVTVRVDPEAPLKAPIGRDDVVDAEEIAEKSRIDVDVLLNDNDPDGSVNDLKVTAGGDTRVSGGTISVPVKDTSQIISYQLEDADGLIGGAFIMVPGRAEIGPVLVSQDPVEVDAGKTVEFELADYVRTRPGTTPRITEESKVNAQHADGSPLVVSATKLAFTSDPDYFGDTALSFEATDGDGPDDPSGKKAVLAIPITVRPTSNQPPTLTGAAVEISAGETNRVDLRALSADPDPGDVEKLAYRLAGGEVEKVRGEIEGGNLVLTAGADANKGAFGTLIVDVEDPSGEKATGRVDVRVTSSDRPLAVANEDIVEEAAVGKESSVAVLANDSNPFPDKPLKLLSASVQSGDGKAATVGDKVNVTPSATGTLVVQYRVADATGDSDREVTGRIRLIVRDKPDAPSAPRVEEVRNRTAVLSWTPPSNNGAQITSYRVSSDQGFSQECQTTTCTLEGLTNGTEYFFTVTATNAVGQSDPSARSASARPDAKPDTPQPPTLVDGDKQLAISWSPPKNDGSPIRSYTLELSPSGPGGSSMTGLSGTSTTITGLQNGVSYKARIQAVNDAPDPSEFSPWSAAAVPAAVPDAPTAPTATRASSSINGGVIDLAWSAPATNGADISAYDVLVFKAGAQVDSRKGLAATSSSLQFTGLDQKSEYAFAVIAINRVGSSAQGAKSTPVVPYGLPTAPGNVSASFGDGRATVKYAAADGNGAPVTSYKVSGNNGAGATCNGTSCDVTGLANGTNYTFTVVAVNAAGDGPKSSASPSGSPFGKPKAPSISGQAAGKAVTFTWDSNESGYKNGRDLSSVSVKFDNTTVSNNGSVTLGDGYDQNHTLTIEVCATEGGCATSTASVRSGAAPAKTVKVSWVAGQTYERRYVVTIANFAPNSSVACTAAFDAQYGGARNFNIPTDGNGNGSVKTNLESSLPLESSGDLDAFTCGGVRGTR